MGSFNIALVFWPYISRSGERAREQESLSIWRAPMCPVPCYRTRRPNQYLLRRQGGVAVTHPSEHVGAELLL